MAHFTRVRADGTWTNGTVLTAEELDKFDDQGVAAINGDGGGVWNPSTEILIGGTFGINSRILRGGDDGLGGETFEVNGGLTTVVDLDVLGDASVAGTATIDT